MKWKQIERLLIFLIALVFIRSGSIRGQDLSVAMNGNGEWISRFDPLVFTFSRPVAAGEHINLIVGTTDVTNLCTVHNDTLFYSPGAVPLPSGVVNVSVYDVTPAGTSTSVGSFTLNVLTTAGLEKLVAAPSITLSNRGQLAEESFPGATTQAPGKSQELNGQMALRVDLERDGVAADLGFSMVGVSLKQEALRFGEKREDASKLDLASYLIEGRKGRTVLSAGQVTHGRHRFLLNSFSSRGISGGTAIGEYVDVSAAVMNATNVVGWDNFLGLDNPEHRIYSGTLGVEMFPQNPGTVRVEGSYTDASQQPFGSFNRGQINDAEKSNGGGIRMVLADPGRYVTLDAGFAKTRFTNPSDPLLSRGFSVVPVEASTRQARYADLTWQIVRNATVLSALPARLSVAFRHELVDPLYRAVGVSTRPDFLQNTYELHSGAGPLQVDLNHLESEDNLADVPSVLKSRTRQTGATAILTPLLATGILPSWLPALTYNLNSTHQFGVSTPVNSNFTPTRVPDQLTTSHSAGIEWQSGTLRAGYHGALTTQDNREVGRENADVVNRAHGLNISYSPATVVSINLDGALESTENTGTGLVNRNRRVGVSVLAQPVLGSSASVNASLSRSKPDDGTSLQRQASFSLETSYAFTLPSAPVLNWRGQVFARYSWNEFTSENSVFNLNTTTRSWVINTGVTFSIF